MYLVLKCIFGVEEKEKRVGHGVGGNSKNVYFV